MRPANDALKVQIAQRLQTEGELLTTQLANEGLVISSKIFHELSGSLHACCREQGMSMEFDLAVDLWKPEQHVHV